MIFFRDTSKGWAVLGNQSYLGSEDNYYEIQQRSTLDGGAHWTWVNSFLLHGGAGSTPPLRHYKPNNQTSCLVFNDDAACFETPSRQDKTRLIHKKTSSKLTSKATSFLGSENIWAATSNGLLSFSDNGGNNWHRVTRKIPSPQSPAWLVNTYHIFPAPWYYLDLLAVGLLLGPALRSPKPEVVSESAADLLVSDNPISSQAADVFDFSAVALGLSRFLRNEKTLPPLTIAVTGEWGSGKSSLMNLLRADLERYGFRPVWFNAWHHQKEENLLASLLETIRPHAIPPWWRPEGAFFRGKLLKIRWLRFWPVVTLFLVVFAFSLGYLQAHPAQLDAFWKVVEDIPTSVAELVNLAKGESQTISADKEAEGHVPWLAFLLSSAGLLVSLWKGLKGFGVSPASLLAKDSGSAKVKDLENLTGFRYRFAAEFKDITQALNPRTLLILIDDLDRCRPEMVLEVLESVNFLVSSGDCFVVMGMARERVVRCVGLSFKDVASEFLTAAPDPAQGTPEEIARRQRIEFAQQYLEKLINIEVPVPSPTDEQSRRLMLAASEPPVPAEPESKGRILARQAWELTRKVLPFAAFAGLLVLGYWFGATRSVNGPAVAPAPAQQAAVPSPAQKSPKTAPVPESSAQKPLPTAPARMEPGDESQLPLYPAIVLLVVLVGLGIWRLSIPPGVVLHDSPDFEQALRTWHPLVFSFRSTPRSIKRFLNRVRYLAMLQRKQVPEPTLWQAILAWLLRRSLQKGEQVAAGNGHPAPIPEDILVALAAIEYCHPECLQSEIFFLEPRTFLKPGLLSEEIRKILPSLLTYREPYFRVSKGVHMS